MASRFGVGIRHDRVLWLAEVICKIWPGPVEVSDEPEVIEVEDLARTFHAAMLTLYKQALTETGYNASQFAAMISERGGLQTAKDLLASSGVSQGFTTLWEKGRLDLVVEAVVLDPQYQELFSDEELEVARERLAMYGGGG